MFEINTIIKNQLIDYCLQLSDQEACGLIVKTNGTTALFPAKNIHDDAKENFAIAAQDYANAYSEGEILAIFHSHNDVSVYNGKLDFSEADKVACEASGLPWVLVILPQQDIKILEPSGYRPPLLGREFSYGTLDCYALVRDAFFEVGIELKDYPRGNLYEWNANPEWNLFEESFANEGFVEIDKNSVLQKYDVLLMQIESTKINHIGLIWEPDKNIFIHHLINRLSEPTVYGGYWKGVTLKIARHQKYAGRD